MRCNFLCAVVLRYLGLYFFFMSYFYRTAFVVVRERHLAIHFSGLCAIAQVGVPRDVEVISGVSS